LATAPLVIGDNLLAVEAHQTSGDTADLVFGMSLLAATQFPVVITDPSQPADREVGAGDPTTFSAEFVGTPPLSFHWLKDGNPIEDATNATLTLDPVLQEDTGAYALEIVNLLSTNVTRSAVLTVTNSPVRITDSDQPADVTITEGLPVIFTVAVVGSAPISYQWHHGVEPITGETNAIFAIPEARMSDAGDYHVVVTNPFPSSITSRTARLTVTADTDAPEVVGVVGTPNKITITFSEPLDPASANAMTNYALNGGLTVTGAAQDSADASIVVLTTSAQTLGASYALTIDKVLDRFDNAIAPNTMVPFKSRIVIDGSFDDWATVPLAFSDPPQDSSESTDYQDVYVANDDDYLYLRVTLHTPSELGIFYNNLFLDTDNDPTTGYPFGGIGSDMLVQSGGGYQEKNGGFNEGDIDGLDWAMAPTGVGDNFEFRISRHAAYASDGLAVFATNVVGIVLESENTGFQTRDTAPDAGGFGYTFAGSSQLAPLDISFSQTGPTISWAGPGKLQMRQSLITGSWQDVENPTNPYPLQTTNSESYYRLSQ
jgi:hypothetical protein